MRLSILLASFVLASVSHAGSFSIPGPGGNIPASGTGGGSSWPAALPPAPFVSSINVPFNVIEITRVNFLGLNHTFAGDLHAVLRDPTGKGYNIFVRSGSSSGSTGNTGDFAGSYGFLNAVTGNGSPFPGTGNIAPGDYRQDFGDSGTPATPWPNGHLGIFNTPLNDIVAPAGIWSLEIYDCVALDSGTLTSWSLTGVDDNPPISAYCLGDGTSGAPCPCANTGASGHGCQNSAGTGGSLLTATGSVFPDSVVLQVTGELPTALSIVVQSNSHNGTPVVFGDGLKCFAGTQIKRLYAKNAVGGSVTAPGPGDPSITARSAQLGDTIPLAGVRYYQVYYRDANPSFCTAPTGSTFNISNGLKIIWF